MRTIAVCNHKGGVGKTTSVLNLGAGLNLLDKSILIIDLDPQANLSQSAGAANKENNSYTLLKKTTRPQPYPIKGKLDIIPAVQELSEGESELNTQPGREFLLKEAMELLKKSYDYILIDCPPALNLLTINALTYCKEVFIPLQSQYLAIHGLNRLLDIIQVVRNRLNPGLELSGIILTQYDRRKVLNREIDQTVREEFKSLVFRTIIRDNIALAEAPLAHTDIFEYAAGSYGAADYMNLCREVVNQKNGNG